MEGSVAQQRTRVPCVGAIVRDDRGRVLMVKRGTEPGRGLWSIPGGRVEPGETSRQAVVREVEEETRVRVSPSALAGVVERDGPQGSDGPRYVIEDWFARVEAGSDPRAVRAGDDADEARWVFPDDLESLPCVAGLVESLRAWRVVPQQRGR